MKTPDDIKAFCSLAEKTARLVSNDIRAYHDFSHIQFHTDGSIEIVFSDGYCREDEIWVTVTFDQLSSDHEELLKQKQAKEAEAKRLASERAEKEKKEAAVKKEANERKTYERLAKKYGPQ